MKYIQFFLVLAIVTLGISACSQALKVADTKEPPLNIIFIFPHQYRNFSLGIWSQPGYQKHIQSKPDLVSKPAIDKLASQRYRV